jgi:hypothetical protein
MFGRVLDAVMIPTEQAILCAVRTNILQPGVKTRKNTGTEEKTRKGEIGSTANEIPRITSWVAGCTLRDHMCNGNFREKPGEGDVCDLLHGSTGLMKSNGGVTGELYRVCKEAVMVQSN